MRRVAEVFVGLVLLVAAWRSWILPEQESARSVASRSEATPAMGAAGAGDTRPMLVEVPRLLGVDDSLAKHVLALTHLRTGTIRLEASSRPWGSVIEQSIAPGASVRRGVRIDLVLAKGSVPEPCRLYWCSTGTAAAQIDNRPTISAAKTCRQGAPCGSH